MLEYKLFHPVSLASYFCVCVPPTRANFKMIKEKKINRCLKVKRSFLGLSSFVLEPQDCIPQVLGHCLLVIQGGPRYPESRAVGDAVPLSLTRLLASETFIKPARPLSEQKLKTLSLSTHS